MRTYKTRIIKAVSLTLVGFTSLIQAQTETQDSLMPQPAKVQAVSAPPLLMTTAFCVSVPYTKESRLERAAQRMVSHVANETGLPLVPSCEPGIAPAMIVQVDDLSSAPPTVQTDESYTLDTSVMPIRLQAKGIYGAIDGMETVTQMVEARGNKFVISPMRIEDAPRFHWRGLMIDAGRHFMPPAVIYRTLDGMAAVKLNVLHWHLTEDQGFRIESLRFPHLQELGSNGAFYTQQQVREIVTYAADRGIRVVPEFDLPGHSTSWLVGYPKLASGPGPYHIETKFGVLNAAVDPTRESTYTFLDAFFAEMANLFPDQYFHTGGDESNGKEWLANPTIVRFMHEHNLKDPSALQAYFNQRLEKLLASHGKRMIGWDEVLVPGISADTAIQDWHGTDRLIRAAKEGHPVVYSMPAFYYLDHMPTAEQIYAGDPLPQDSGLTPEQESHVLGAEACMWSEAVDATTIDTRIWPDAAAEAERLWSPASVHDVDDMYDRLRITSLRLESRGLMHLSRPEAGLRDLAATTNDRAIETFASLLQPVGFGERRREQSLDAHTPFDELGDFLFTDPPIRHQLQVTVARYLKDRASNPAAAESEANELQTLFSEWSAASVEIAPLLVSSPRLAHIQHRVDELHSLAIASSSALKHLQRHEATDSEWQLTTAALLKQAAEHEGMVDFAILPPIQALISASAGSR